VCRCVVVRLCVKEGTSGDPESYGIEAVECADECEDDVLDDPGEGVHALGSDETDDADDVEHREGGLHDEGHYQHDHLQHDQHREVHHRLLVLDSMQHLS
jgi:hypothetical protein